MATYPLTEAKFRELMEKIQVNRLARHAQYSDTGSADLAGVADAGESSAAPDGGGVPGVRH